jgi:hypothetical protein
MIVDKFWKKVGENLAITVDVGRTVDTLTSVASEIGSLTIADEASDDTEISFSADAGEDGLEHLITITYESDGETYEHLVALLVNKTPQLYYGSVYDADIYFDEKLENDLWTTSEKTKRTALLEATRLIERLPFKGTKTDSGQSLEFPRGGDTAVPDEIVWASFEIAYQLLDGITADALLRSAKVTQNQYANVSTHYDPRYTPEHVSVGIPSAMAWTWLKPYIRDTRDLTFKRMS